MVKKILDQQSQHWEKNFSYKPEMFGLKPSLAAIKALQVFKKNNINKILELGAGLGRDTIYFAKNSIYVDVLDYSRSAIKIIDKKVKELNLSKFVKTKVYDIREKLPFDDKKFQGCFSHMLYCMALKNPELLNLNKEILRVLKPNGLNIYTARNTNDGDYKNGKYIDENLYEKDGFIVHFFSEEKVKNLTDGFDILNIEKFEEGSFPRKLFMVTLRKKLFTG